MPISRKPKAADSLETIDALALQTPERIPTLRLAPNPPPRLMRQPEVFVRRDGRQLKRLTLFIPVELEVPLRLHAALRGLDVSSAIANIVWQHLVQEQKEALAPELPPIGGY